MVERSLSFRVRQYLVLVLVAMLAFGPFTRAYADGFEGGGGASSSFNNNFGTVWYGPTGSGGVANTLYVRYGVVANTKYDAALYCCRGSNFDLSDLSNSKKSKLLNNGDFKQFADLFKVGKPELTDDWGGDASIVQAWNSARQLYGETYCWNARYTNDQKIRAQEAIEDVLNDDDTPSGGGGGSGSVGGGIMDTSDLPDTVELLRLRDIPVAQWQSLDLDITEVKSLNPNASIYPYCIIQVFSNGHTEAVYPITCRVEVLFLKSDDIEYYWDEDAGCAVFISNVNVVNYEYYGTATLNNDGTFTPFVYAGGVGWNAPAGHKVPAGSSAATRPVIYASYISQGYTGGGGGGDDEPTEPPIDWPDPPTEVPTPPEVPTPGDPTQPTPPDPVTPTPGNPWIPIPYEDITITGEDFQDLIDALNEHCIHLQNSIQDNVSQLWDLQSEFLGTQFEDLFGQISDNFTWLGNDVIAESYNDLKSYLHELFEWLSEQLNFDVQVEGGQYDDTSVLYWLKQIWAKLPTGINTRPTDPVTNPDGWWDWLTQLLNNLAADLMALGHDELAGVLETLNELRNKFPFSLPWDVAALLGLLVGVPECPEFDMPCYTVSLEGLQQVGTYHITLEPYETVWEGVKWIETLAFAVYLITHTGGLMDMVTKTVRPR